MSSIDAYIDTIERMERDLAAVDLAPAAASIAISLKRLADAAENIAKGLLPPVYVIDKQLTLEEAQRLQEAIQKGGPILTEAPQMTITRSSSLRVPLGECRAGLFLYDGELCVKTQYSTRCTTVPGVYKPDCYIVATGEYFCGGQGVKEADLRNLLVLPVAPTRDATL